jgi:ketosteroid isomerase-like protein
MILDTGAFRHLMMQLADGWSRQDTELALDCFTPDAVYMEPPNLQLFVGYEQLRPYFAALQPGTYMQFHSLWFDETAQTGVGEFSFGRAERPTADHGIAVVQLQDGKIAFWHEYQRKGPADFAQFLAVAGKQWEWHGGNYP